MNSIITAGIVLIRRGGGEMKIGSTFFDFGKRTYIMGILNVTPDSFSDGGEFSNPEKAVLHGLRMEEEGADIIDIGGESTRPGHAPVSVKDEITRVIPVIEQLSRRLNIPISIDTSKAEVAEAALSAGADMINDVWGLTSDEKMPRVAADAGVPCCLMHNQEGTFYKNLMEDILQELRRRVDRAVAAGVDRGNIILDPGIGFGKTVRQNIEVMRHLERMSEIGLPWLLGTSRKSMIGKSLNLPVKERLSGSLATNVIGIKAGTDFIRIHDVKAHVQAARMTDVIVRPPQQETHTVCISLGSNVGDRSSNIKEAMKKIGEIPETHILRRSNLYETSPVGKTDQPEFLNAAAVLQTACGPEELLQHLMGVEKELGRVRTERWGPRTIDLDILLYDNVVYESETLRIPHPRMKERLFVLVPLAEIAALFIHPEMNLRIMDIMKSGAFDGQKVRNPADRDR